MFFSDKTAEQAEEIKSPGDIVKIRASIDAPEIKATGIEILRNNPLVSQKIRIQIYIPWAILNDYNG